VNSSNLTELRDITTGIETPEAAEVLTGLVEGDKVVISGRSQLKPGTTVTSRLSSTPAQGAKN